jgi:hypothetical protein
MAKFSLTAQIGLQAPSNTKQVVSQIQNALKGVSVNVNINANTRQLSQASNQLNSVNQSAKAANASVSELGKTIGAAARRFGAISLITGTFLGLSRSIKNSLGDAIEFERQMVVLSQVTGKSVKQLNDLYNEVTRLATGFGVSSEGLLKTSIILAQAGLEAGKTKAALEILAKTQLAASFDDIASTTEGAIAILAQFKREAASAGGEIAFLEQSLEAINQVSKKYAVESSDLVAVIRRSGGAFEAAGGSLNELLALFTSVRATTRESAETISTGLRTIFTRIQRVDTIRQLKDLGIELQDLEGKFVGPFEAIKRISEGLSSLDPRDFRFAQIVEQLGGFRQISKVVPLIKQFGLAQDALNTAQSASGSLTADVTTAQKSLANQLTKVNEEFQALIRKFSDSEAFKSVAGGALEFARALIRIADAIEPLLPMIASLAAVQVGRGLVSAVGALTGFGGMGGQRRNGGGKIYGFNTGGMVPGSGNRDTVPARLTPGEFVIRKASVKKFGAENLARLNKGGIAEAPLVDDLPNTKDAMKPRPGTDPGSPLAEIIRAGGGALDFDRTLQRTVGDQAYANAKNDKERQAVLQKYFRDPASRLKDAKGGHYGAPAPRLTQFGEELQKLIKAGQIDPRNLALISKSSRTPGLPEHVKELFGIPIENMVFTSGGSKQPALDALRQKGPRIDRIQRKALGGLIQKFAKGGKAKLVGDMAKQESVGALILQPNSSIQNPSEKVGVNYSDVASYDSSFNNTKFDKKYILEKSGIKDDPNGSYYEILNNGLNDGIKNAVNTATENIAKTLKINNVAVEQESSEFSQYINKSARGVIFEEVIAQLSRKSGGEPYDDRKDTQAPFDFIGSIGKTTDLFANQAAAAAKYKDAKSSDSNKLIPNFQGKIARQIAEENYSSIVQQTSPQVINDLKNSPTNTEGWSKAALSEFLYSKKLTTKTPTNDQINDALEKIGITPSLFKEKGKDKRGSSLGYIWQFAKGGIAPSDTVPALLTPGEFVINKNTAQRVGYGKLHRLNKTGDVQGYAKGGVVGGIQRFAQGGKPDLGTVGQFNKGDPESYQKVEAYLKKVGMSAQQVQKVFDNVAQALNQGIKPVEALKQGVREQVELIKKEKEVRENNKDEQEKQTGATSTLIRNILGSAQQFVFLAGITSSIATQFTSLDEATKAAATQTIAFASTLISSAGTVADLGVTFFDAISNLKNAQGGFIGGISKVLTPVAALIGAPVAAVGLALGGLAVVVGGAAAYFYFIKARSKELSDQMKKSADQLGSDIESGKQSTAKRNNFVELEVKATQHLIDSFFFLSVEVDKEIALVRQAANSYINLLDAALKLEKGLRDIDVDKSLSVGQKAGKKIEIIDQATQNNIAEFQKSSEGLAKLFKEKGIAGFQEIETNPDVLKTKDPTNQIAALRRNFDKAAQGLTNIFPSIREQLQVQLEDSIRQTNFDFGGPDLFNQLQLSGQSFADTFRKTLEGVAGQIELQAKALEQVGKFVEADELRRGFEGQKTAFEESAKRQAELGAKAKQSFLQFLKTVEESRKLAAITEALTIKFSGLRDTLSDFETSLEFMSSVIANNLPNFKFKSIQGLDDISKVIDVEKFQKDVNNVGGQLGDQGKIMANSIGAVAKLFKNSQSLLNRSFGALANDEAGEGAREAIDAIFKPLKDITELQPLIASATASLLKATSTESENQSTITQAELESAIGPFKEIVGPYADVFKNLIDLQNEYLDKYQKYTTELFAVFKQELDFREELVNIQERAAERFSEAIDRPLTTSQKQGFRTAKTEARLRGAGLGPGLANDVAGLGKAFSDANKQLIKIKNDTKGKAPNLDQIRQTRELTLKSQEASNALKKLSDQSALAADVLKDIGKEKAKRQAAAKIIQDFVTGNFEERQTINDTFAATQMSMAAGTTLNFAPDVQKAIYSLIDQLAAGDEDGPMAQIKKQLLYRDALLSGIPQQLAQTVLTGTSKEAQLQKQLSNIFAQEQAALEALRLVNKDNTTELTNNTNEITKLNNTLQTTINDTLKEAIKAYDARIKEEEKKKKTQDEADKKTNLGNRKKELEGKKGKLEKDIQDERAINKPRSERIKFLEDKIKTETESVEQKLKGGIDPANLRARLERNLRPANEELKALKEPDNVSKEIISRKQKELDEIDKELSDINKPQAGSNNTSTAPSSSPLQSIRISTSNFTPDELIRFPRAISENTDLIKGALSSTQSASFDPETQKDISSMATDTGNFIRQALKPGSIYTHDIHSETLLKDVIQKLEAISKNTSENFEGPINPTTTDIYAGAKLSNLYSEPTTAIDTNVKLPKGNIQSPSLDDVLNDFTKEEEIKGQLYTTNAFAGARIPTATDEEQPLSVTDIYTDSKIQKARENISEVKIPSSKFKTKDIKLEPKNLQEYQDKLDGQARAMTDATKRLQQAAKDAFRGPIENLQMPEDIDYNEFFHPFNEEYLKQRTPQIKKKKSPITFDPKGGDFGIGGMNYGKNKITGNEVKGSLRPGGTNYEYSRFLNDGTLPWTKVGTNGRIRPGATMSEFDDGSVALQNQPNKNTPKPPRPPIGRNFKANVLGTKNVERGKAYWEEENKKKKNYAAAVKKRRDDFFSIKSTQELMDRMDSGGFPDADGSRESAMRTLKMSQMSPSERRNYSRGLIEDKKQKKTATAAPKNTNQKPPMSSKEERMQRARENITAMQYSTYGYVPPQRTPYEPDKQTRVENAKYNARLRSQQEMGYPVTGQVMSLQQRTQLQANQLAMEEGYSPIYNPFPMQLPSQQENPYANAVVPEGLEQPFSQRPMASSPSDTNPRTNSPDLSATNKNTANIAAHTKPLAEKGSAYTHDIHSEKVLISILAVSEKILQAILDLKVKTDTTSAIAEKAKTNESATPEAISALDNMKQQQAEVASSEDFTQSGFSDNSNTSPVNTASEIAYAGNQDVDPIATLPDRAGSQPVAPVTTLPAPASVIGNIKDVAKTAGSIDNILNNGKKNIGAANVANVVANQFGAMAGLDQGQSSALVQGTNLVASGIQTYSDVQSGAKPYSGVSGISREGTLGAARQVTGLTAATAVDETAQMAVKNIDNAAIASAKGATKVVTAGVKTGVKSAAKKIPIASLVAGAALGINRALNDDVLGGVGEVVSGVVANVPLAGTAISAGIDGLLAYKDYQENVEKTQDAPIKDQERVARIARGELTPTELAPTRDANARYNPDIAAVAAEQETKKDERDKAVQYLMGPGRASQSRYAGYGNYGADGENRGAWTKEKQEALDREEARKDEEELKRRSVVAPTNAAMQPDSPLNKINSAYQTVMSSASSLFDNFIKQPIQAAGSPEPATPMLKQYPRQNQDSNNQQAQSMGIDPEVMQSLNQSLANFSSTIPSAFNSFADRMETIANIFNGLTVNHELNVTGALSMNSTEVANAVKDAVTSYITDEINKILKNKDRGNPGVATS